MKVSLAAAATLAILSSPAMAQADNFWSEIHGTVGARLWNVDWSSWFQSSVPGSSTTIAQYRNADKETTFIPLVSLRYKEFLVSGSYMLPKDFQFPIAGYPATERREYDVNFGYFLAPGLVVSLGYKNVKYESSDGEYTWNLKGPTLGMSGSAPLAQWASLYGNLAFGRPKLKDNAVFNDVRANYVLTEVGLAFPLTQMSDSLRGLVLTAGYRYQRIGAKPNVAPSPGHELFEHTQGPVLGLSFSM
jgi:hypothetical protein